MPSGISSDLILRIRALDGATARKELERTAKELEKVGGAAQATGKKTRQAGEHFKLMGSAMGGIKWAAATAGFGGLALGLKDVVQKGVQFQEQQAQLRQALAATGIKGTASLNMVTDAAEKLSMRGGYMPTEQLQGINQFIRLTGSATKAIQLNKAATDMARGSVGRLDFTMAQRILGQALTGNTGRLQRYIGILQPVKTHVDALTGATKKSASAIAQESRLRLYNLQVQASAMGKAGGPWLRAQRLILANQIAQEKVGGSVNRAALQHAELLDRQATAQLAIARIQRMFHGSTSRFANTAAGALSNAHNAIDIAMQKIGSAILPVVAKIAKEVAKLATWIADHWKPIAHVIKAALSPLLSVAKAIFHSKTAMQALGSVVMAAAGVWAIYTLYAKAAAAVTALMEMNPLILGLTAAAAAVIFLSMHFKEVAKIATQVFRGLKMEVTAVARLFSSVFSAVFSFIGNHWKLMLTIMTGGLAAPVLFIVSHFRQIGRAAGDVVSFIARVFRGLFNVIAWPFKQAWKVIQGIANAIVSAFRWVVDKVKNAFGFVTSLPGKIAKGAGSLLHSATFGLLHDGGEVKPRYMARGGPVGQDTVPGWLSPGEFVLNRQTAATAGSQALNQWNKGGAPPGGQAVTVNITPLPVNIDGRRVAEAVLRYTIGRAARGSSSLVGGSMTTGARTAG